MERRPHRDRFDEFWRTRTQVADPFVSTHFKTDRTHEIDYALVACHARPDSEVLDLGAGNCIVAGRLANSVARVVAVDKYEEFLNRGPQAANLVKIGSDLLEFTTGDRFDLVLLFGVITYFDHDEAAFLYEKCARWLKPGGKLIVKHQCGVNEDVLVDTFSPQIGQQYIAFYGHVETEERLLRRWFANVETIDIYPPENNPWPNTHFYAFVCDNEG